MGCLIDLTGRTFGRWKVLKRVRGSNPRVTYWLCQCSCQPVKQKSVEAHSLRAGISRSCGCLTRQAASSRSGPNSPSWKGGRYLMPDGYIRLTKRKGRSKLEHRDVMEKQLGRELTARETVHHKNGIRSDNRPENLELRYSVHGEGQSIGDLKAWAVEFLKLHAPELLK